MDHTAHTSPRMNQLAEEGIVMDRHYAHWHCSPSRRSFISGRLSIHTGEDLSSEFDDHMDNRWTWISEKLKSVGYYNVFYGKGHIGFRSRQYSLPVNRGFDHHYGMLDGYQDYRSPYRWENNDVNSQSTSYSTLLVGKTLEEKILQHFGNNDGENAAPIFAFASFQAPHSPIQCPNLKIQEERDRYGDSFPAGVDSIHERMIYALDLEVGKIVDALKKVNQWDNTLLVFTSDNGGTRAHYMQTGSNHPLRGEKTSSYEGGIRTATFLSGGVVPKPLHGSRTQLVAHISDWYSTFCYLAGVDPSDGPRKKPRHANIDLSTVKSIFKPAAPNGENLYGPKSYPDIDSVNLWPHILAGPRVSKTAAHEYLPVSGEVVIAGDYKLVTGQPCDRGIRDEKDCKTGIYYGWISKSRAWYLYEPTEVELNARPSLRCQRPIDFQSDEMDPLTPCLFNLAEDPFETQHIFDEPEVMTDLWTKLNNTMKWQYNTRIPGKEHGLNPLSSKCSSTKRDMNFINQFYFPV